MRTRILLAIAIVALASCANKDDGAKIIALERGALDRWGKGDPGGYLDLYASDVTYFDPSRDKRADGFAAMKDYYAPIAGKVKVDSYDIIDPKVQRKGDVAVLSYQLVSRGKSPQGVPFAVHWNSTKVYGLVDGNWKIFHDHWSYIKPELKQASPE
jgi:ketosteroid isomerase-like protein